MSEPVNREYTKNYPNDKLELLERHNYEMYNLDLMRKVFPRIINEINNVQGRQQRKFQSRDIISLYFYLLSYVNGNYLRSDGSINNRCGAAFPSYEKITSDLNIDHRRIKLLTDILDINGLLLETRDYWEGTKRYKLYFVSFCPRISDDGYIINVDGERIQPDYSSIEW